ncbi:MAG: hypothetical protein DDG60_04900 [Anaerolineae bacterium]|nr:MAG: hypothetical protein DDG60_04900 [Anaerolineae bacterium]
MAREVKKIDTGYGKPPFSKPVSMTWAPIHVCGIIFIILFKHRQNADKTNIFVNTFQEVRKSPRRAN